MLDHAREVAVSEMENRILLGFALQHSALGWLAPAECMAVAGVSWARGEPGVWTEAVHRLVDRGVLRLAAWRGIGWCVPALSPAPGTRLPYDRAAAIRLKMPRARREARIVVPRYG